MAPRKTSHTVRLGKTELDWLTRHGKGLGRQLREDLALLRLLLDSSTDPSMPIGRVVQMAQQLIAAQ